MTNVLLIVQFWPHVITNCFEDRFCASRNYGIGGGRQF